MKPAELVHAQQLVAEHETYLRLRQRLLDGDPLRLLLGEGGSASEIVLAAAFVDRLRADLAAGFAAKAGDAAARLNALGVEV